LRVRFPLFVSAIGVIGGAMVVSAKWLYVHRSNSAIGSWLSVMADLVPMAIALVGIIISYKIPRKEHHLRTTLILIACGSIRYRDSLSS